MADKKRFKMGTPADVKRTLNRISNMVLNGELEAKDANAIIYACNAVLAVIRVDEQEKRLAELEQLVNERVQNE